MVLPLGNWNVFISFSVFNGFKIISELPNAQTTALSFYHKKSSRNRPWMPESFNRNGFFLSTQNRLALYVRTLKLTQAVHTGTRSHRHNKVCTFASLSFILSLCVWFSANAKDGRKIKIIKSFISIVHNNSIIGVYIFRQAESDKVAYIIALGWVSLVLLLFYCCRWLLRYCCAYDDRISVRRWAGHINKRKMKRAKKKFDL